MKRMNCFFFLYYREISDGFVIKRILEKKYLWLGILKKMCVDRIIF